ncbi:response regulator [Roseibium sp. TrichSKD4]|nr:response regulator [Roseibium sp. TrichSKD4]
MRPSKPRMQKTPLDPSMFSVLKGWGYRPLPIDSADVMELIT